MKNIIFLNTTDNYPLKFTANNSKNELIARGLIEHGDKVCFIDGPQGSSKVQSEKHDVTNDNIEYYVFPKTKFRHISNVLRSLALLRKHKQKKDNYLVLSFCLFPLFLTYIFVAKCLGYKIIVTITEWHLYFENMSFAKKIDIYLFDKLYGYFVNASLPISKEISDKIKKFKKPELYVPILADFSLISPKTEKQTDDLYFLYCGSLGYFNVIELLINAFEQVSTQHKECLLYLVVDGPQIYKDKLQTLLHEKGIEQKVIIKSQVPYKELISLYCDAFALLIPLRTEKQDTARFPHKIGEYIATGRPIITGNVGEVGRHFTDLQTAFVATAYTPNAYASKMLEAIKNVPLSNSIGANARKLGENLFDYQLYGNKISSFFKTV